MNEPTILRHDQGPVVILTLNRPQRRNALSRDLVAALSDHLTKIEAEHSSRAVVLTGADPVFCAGMDLKESLLSGESEESEKQAIADVQGIADLVDQVHRLSKPTIAALNGDAFAGGAGLAVACDFVIAAEHARIGYPEVRRGLVAAVVMYDLVRQVGERRARSLLLTGEPISAAEAERWGLINRVVDRRTCLSQAIEFGVSLLASGPRAVATTKRLLDEVNGRPANLRGPAAVTAAVRVSEEAEEGMRAFIHKRPPLWNWGRDRAAEE
ncbi:methylglutaconyl-CoA hydratase [Singulisphaera sp. GP187]|uniref:enoyl-CoA hydratase/isomerase family protein n=1 Tax=Singulisphaera sp. GP187 TaxID=1882752 RepID=UPI00092A493E|nr:enoyl-CoA hydratase-related protein [Singulisphaera sp. GP187]SIO02120.1 methylglutaconyl-CoA hydratase [Singulisphaera sp. GP187]